MPRRGRVVRRVLAPDPKYHNRSVAKLINRMMMCGKKSLAEHIVYKAFDVVETHTKRNALDTFEQAMKNATPLLEVKPRRVGGATYQVPVEIRGDRRNSLAMRWLVQYARARKGRSMSERLAAEIMDAAQGQGGAVKKKEDTHRMAEANRAFVHYRW